jgi:hypothetical protein
MTDFLTAEPVAKAFSCLIAIEFGYAIFLAPDPWPLTPKRSEENAKA